MSDDEVLRELNEVRAENARLRKLLGLDGRRAESHAQSWEPSLFPDTPPDCHASPGNDMWLDDQLATSIEDVDEAHRPVGTFSVWSAIATAGS